ncbi:MAG: discoidin domain-containing protein, partial [Acidimicrobiia bacterium]
MTAVLLVVACGADATDESVVRPFSEVQASEFLFENDPSFPGRGIFRVTTTEPMICAIAWGETEALGWFNNSLNMAGTGIVEHDVLLPGAKAGGTYYFRVQGSTANGTLYTTELMTFTLPDRDDAVADTNSFGENLAVGATVLEASSEFGSSWLASNAIDADPLTEWSSAGDGDDAFLTLDLGQPRQVSGVAYLTRSMADGSATVTSFSVVVDGVRYGPFPAGNPADPSVTDLAITGQVFRFEVEE